MDEPTEELDYHGQLRIKQIVRGLKEDGNTVLLISHHSDLLFELCDYFFLWSGSMVNSLEKHELYRNPDLFTKTGIEIPKILEYARDRGRLDEFRLAGIVSFEDMESIL